MPAMLSTVVLCAGWGSSCAPSEDVQCEGGTHRFKSASAEQVQTWELSTPSDTLR